MHLFLLSGFMAASFTVIFLFKLDDIRIKRRKIPRERVYKYLKNRLPEKIFSACMVFMLFVFVIPLCIWMFFEKETATVTRVESKKEMFELSDEDGTFFAARGNEKGKAKYVFRIIGDKGVDNEVVDASKVELVNMEFGEKPKYERIVEYKRSRLKSSGFIASAVNDMFCDMDLKPDSYFKLPQRKDSKEKAENAPKRNPEDLKGWKETYVKEWVKIYIPKGALKDNYNLDSI